MNCGNDCERKKKLKNCLIQLDLLFQWLAAVENKPIEQDGTEMGSNFAKYKIIPEYNEFIKYACQAEEHFSTKDYNSCGNSCRFSLEAFTDYIYKKEKLEIDSEFFVLDKKTGARVLDTKNKTGYKLTTGWLNAKISSPSFQEYFRKKNAFPTRTEKTLADKFSHYEENFVYDAKGAVSILSMIYNLYAHCVDKKCFVGTPRFDVSLLENAPKELIKPQLSIEVNGREEKIPQNALLEAVLSKNVSDDLIKQNLSLIDKTDVLGNTPLSLAVYNDDLGTVEMLLKNGADPNFYFKNWIEFGFGGDFHKSVNEEIAKNPDKFSCVWEDYIYADSCIPLIVAIRKDNVDIVRLLLQYSAKTWDSCLDDWYNVAKIPTECSTLLTCAIFYNATKCVWMLLEDEIIDNNGKKIEVSIDPERVDSENVYNSRKIYGTIEGVTALMLASEKGNFDVVDQLLDKGARIDPYDECNNSVFLHAVQDKRGKNVLGKLLRTAKKTLGEEKTKEIVNHSGSAGCPISYVDKDDADLLLKYGADVNAKNENGSPCVEDVAYLNPDLLPWFISHGAKFDFKAFFYRNLNSKYRSQFYLKVLRALSDFITLNDLNFTVPIDNVPRITPLVDAILFSKVKNIQNNIDMMSSDQIKTAIREIKVEIPYEGVKISPLDDALIAAIADIKGIKAEISEYESLNASDSLVKELLKALEEHDSEKKIEGEKIKTAIRYVKALEENDTEKKIEIEREKIETAIRYVKALEENGTEKKTEIEREKIKTAIRDVKSARIYIALEELLKSLEEYDRKKKAVMKKIKVLSIDKELEELLKELLEALKEYDSKKKTVKEKKDVAIRGVKSKISNYESLVVGYFEASTIYLTKGIEVSELTKILLLSVRVHDVPEKAMSAWNKVLVALKLREKDINFKDVLFDLCKNHPKDDFDIAEEFINNGYNFYRFANYNLVDFWLETYASSVSDSNYYKNCMYPIENEDGTYNASPSIEDVRKRNNSSFLKNFGETSFQDVNIWLIRNAISFGANPHEQDEIHKTALDYAKENGIDESLLNVKPFLQTGNICMIQPDNTDKTKILDGQVVSSNGEVYKFKKRIFDKNLKEVAYDDSYNGKPVVFVIQKDSEVSFRLGIADLVTLVDC